MRQLRLVNIFYALPLIFLVLTGSPNLNGERIGSTLGYMIILFLVVGYINFRNPTNGAKLAKDVLAAMLVIGCAYLGFATNAEFASTIVLWPLLHLIRPANLKPKILLKVIQGLTLFCLVYFGINQYGVENLGNSRVMLLLLVFVLQYLFIATQFGWHKKLSMQRELGMSYLVTVLSLLVYAWLMFAAKYMLYLFFISAPSFFILTKLVVIEAKESQIANVRNFRILAIAGLTIFNLYLFLDTTQVLQAVMGGY